MIEQVNGYVCYNCSDVALAKRDIDPAHPKDQPGGGDKTNDSTGVDRNTAVTFGGALAQTEGSSNSAQAVAPGSPADTSTTARAGSIVDIAA